MPLAPDPIAGKEDESKAPRRTSEKFCASDADVKFVSSDNVLLHIHRKNLEVVAGGFPPSEFDTDGEEVPLTEDAATLELLFQFIYPSRHPDLKDAGIETLGGLAEAAEKYEIFSVMNICKTHMQLLLPKHPIEVANYASKHGYIDILVEAPPFILDIPLDELAKSLSISLLAPWICYREAWSRAAFRGVTTMPARCMKHGDGGMYCDVCRKTWGGFQHVQLWGILGEKRSREALEELYLTPNIHCMHVKPLKERVEEELRNVPSFDTFL